MESDAKPPEPKESKGFRTAFRIVAFVAGALALLLSIPFEVISVTTSGIRSHAKLNWQA
jgi:hypothetical protein